MNSFTLTYNNQELEKDFNLYTANIKIKSNLLLNILATILSIIYFAIFLSVDRRLVIIILYSIELLIQLACTALAQYKPDKFNYFHTAQLLITTFVISFCQNEGVNESIYNNYKQQESCFLSRDIGQEQAGYFLGLFYVLYIDGTNLKFKTIQGVWVFFVCYCFIGDQSTLSSYKNLLIFIFLFFAFLTKSYHEEKSSRFVFLEKYKYNSIYQVHANFVKNFPFPAFEIVSQPSTQELKLKQYSERAVDQYKIKNFNQFKELAQIIRVKKKDKDLNQQISKPKNSPKNKMKNIFNLNLNMDEQSLFQVIQKQQNKIFLDKDFEMYQFQSEENLLQQKNVDDSSKFDKNCTMYNGYIRDSRSGRIKKIYIYIFEYQCLIQKNEQLLSFIYFQNKEMQEELRQIVNKIEDNCKLNNMFMKKLKKKMEQLNSLKENPGQLQTKMNSMQLTLKNYNIYQVHYYDKMREIYIQKYKENFLMRDVNVEVFKFSELVKEIMDQIQQKMIKSNVQISINAADDVLEMSLKNDKQRMQQAILNLIFQSLKEAKEQSSIQILCVQNKVFQILNIQITSTISTERAIHKSKEQESQINVQNHRIYIANLIVSLLGVSNQIERQFKILNTNEYQQILITQFNLEQNKQSDNLLYSQQKYQINNQQLMFGVGQLSMASNMQSGMFNFNNQQSQQLGLNATGQLQKKDNITLNMLSFKGKSFDNLEENDQEDEDDVNQRGNKEQEDEETNQNNIKKLTLNSQKNTMSNKATNNSNKISLGDISLGKFDFEKKKNIFINQRINELQSGENDDSSKNKNSDVDKNKNSDVDKNYIQEKEKGQNQQIENDKIQQSEKSQQQQNEVEVQQKKQFSVSDLNLNNFLLNKQMMPSPAQQQQQEKIQKSEVQFSKVTLNDITLGKAQKKSIDYSIKNSTYSNNINSNNNITVGKKNQQSEQEQLSYNLEDITENIDVNKNTRNFPVQLNLKSLGLNKEQTQSKFKQNQ